MNKKGVSPLIGTVLLVAIVIAMILLIMPWVSNMIEKQKQRTTEASRQFDCITKLNFDLSKSADGSIMIDNRGEVDINKITFRKYPVGGGVPTAVKKEAAADKIPSYEVKSFTDVKCDSTLEKIEIIATISSEGKDIVCADSPREIYC
jgi:flagellin-like protein